MASIRGPRAVAFLATLTLAMGTAPGAEAQSRPVRSGDPAVRRAQAPAGARPGSDNDLSLPRADRPGGGGSPPAAATGAGGGAPATNSGSAPTTAGNASVPSAGTDPGVGAPGPGGAGAGSPGSVGANAGVGAANEGGTDTDLSLPRAERPGGGGEPTEAAAAPDATEIDRTKILDRILGIPPESRTKFYGWIENSYTGNTNGRFGGGINFGVNPNYLADRWQGNQYYLIAERVLRQDDTLNFGFRVDNLFGNDAQFNHSNGVLDREFQLNSIRQYDPAQYYVEAHLPILNKEGLDIKVGRFYTLAGYEVVPATGRPLLSVPYMFNYGQPFTHHGVLTTWHFNKNINIYNAAINGWDRQFNPKYVWGYMGGASYTSNDNKTSFTTIFIEGPDQFPTFLSVAKNPIYPTGAVPPPAAFAGKANPDYTSNDRFLFTNVLSHKWSDKLTQIMEVDLAWETNVPFAVDLGQSGKFNRHNAQWYGFANWFLYQFNNKVTGVWRSEVWRDNNGVRTGYAATYNEFTLGAIIKPKPYIWVRPEARYDFADGNTPYNGGTRSSQLTLAFDVILQF